MFDVRTDREFALAHIPGSISIDETGFLRLAQAFPDRGTDIVCLNGTVPAAESILAGEVGQASRGHRLRYYDHNTRIVVFGNSASEARAVADEIALNAYPNSSFFGGTYRELKRAKFFGERKPSPSNLDGLTR